MKVMISLLAACLLLTPALPDVPRPAPEISAVSAVLTDANGRVVYEKDAHRMLPTASTTKIMTALVVLENCDLSERVEIPASCCGIEGSSMLLRPGESYTVRELLTGLLLVSGNDAAAALACCCAGDIASFSALMNAKAKALGMADTHFLNPHGLNEAGHYSTAYDMALLMRAAMDDGRFAEISALERAEVGGRVLLNHNKLLTRCEGCIGGKTGYTQVAGRCLVSCAERSHCRLYCVTLNDPDDWDDHEALYDWAFSRCEEYVFDAGSCRYQIPLLSGLEENTVAVPAKDEKLLLPRNGALRVRAELPFYVFAPAARGSPAGRLRVYDGERLIAVIPMVYAEDCPLNW
ncbi:MAG: D-alanyl-D-alanine carboxypeptidase [Oscillospiraceae bacterium]|nr:D-alanyl-D-alanine carboxypeptidase [Oscillospiraceae bacterium]